MTDATTNATAPVELTAKQSGKNLTKAIGIIRAKGDEFNSLIHKTAMAAAEHAKKHGDAQYAQSLVMAMPASMRRSMLILWFGMFTPIVVKDSEGWTAKLHKESSKLYVPWDLEAADKQPFYVLAEQTPEKSYDFKALVALVERLGKSIQKKIDDGKVPAEDIPSAQGIVTVISGLHFSAVKPEIKPESNSNTEGSETDNEPVKDEPAPEETAGDEPSLKEAVGAELKAA